jgi:hypothetical protein
VAAPDSRAGPSPAPPSDWNVAPHAAPVQRGPLAAFLAYAWAEKVWWIVPMVATLVSLFGLVLFASRQQVAPFFYAVGG